MVTDEDLIERAGLQQRFSIAKQLDTEQLETEFVSSPKANNWLKTL